MEIEQYLSPITGEAPCGDNKYDEYGYGFELDSIIESITGSGGAKMWDSVKENDTTGDWGSCLLRVGGYFNETKHLGLAFFATLSGVNLFGLEGLLGGVKLYKQLLVKYWDNVHPVLEGDDADSRVYQLERLNDQLLIDSLLNVTVVKGRRDVFSFSDLGISKKATKLNSDFLNAAINEMLTDNPQFFEEQLNLVEKVELEIDFLSEDYLAEKLSGQKILFSGLKDALNIVKTVLSKTGLSKTPQEKTVKEDSSLKVKDMPTQGIQFHGDISNRDDVKASLDKIIRFYSKNEPTSPVPGLLKRAKRMVNMNFLEVVKELGLDQNRFESDLIFGNKEKENN